MIGIYKITSPTGRIYIGQAIDIRARFCTYKRLACKQQPLLYRSIIKHGFSAHTFEVIKECSREELNNLESYFIDFYECLGKCGLNCIGGGREIKIRPETALLISNLAKKRKPPFPKGTKIHTDESKERLRQAHTGKKLSGDHVIKIRNAVTGKPKTVKKAMKRQGKMVVNSQTGTFYFTVTEAAKLNNLVKGSLVRQLRGYRTNKTHLTYY